MMVDRTGVDVGMSSCDPRLTIFFFTPTPDVCWRQMRCRSIDTVIAIKLMNLTHTRGNLEVTRTEEGKTW
jgi:hypothetical protein